MAALRRTDTIVAARSVARKVAADHGLRIRDVRRRRRLSQAQVAERLGVSRSQICRIERGHGATTTLEVWFALAAVLELPLDVTLGRDPQEEPADAGHLRIQELVLGLARGAGFDRVFELPTRPADPSRSTDVGLVDRVRRRLVLVECWNTFGDVGAAVRSWRRKLGDADGLGVVLAGDGTPYQIGSCWVVRSTRRNRDLVARYPHVFSAALPGSSRSWVEVLVQGAALPPAPGLVWTDVRVTRLIARRGRADHAATRAGPHPA